MKYGPNLLANGAEAVMFDLVKIKDPDEVLDVCQSKCSFVLCDGQGTYMQQHRRYNRADIIGRCTFRFLQYVRNAPRHADDTWKPLVSVVWRTADFRKCYSGA